MSCSDKKVLVTGATGLIGRELARPLVEAGFEVWAVSRQKNLTNPHINWICGDLFDSAFMEKVIAKVRPTHLLNMAWVTTDDYLSSEANYAFLSSGINLLRSFARHGGRRVVFAGTCFEYEFKDSPLKEDDCLAIEKTTYTFCKGLLNNIATKFCREHDLSYGYGRIFYVYGRNEAKTRLTGMLIDRLSHGENAIVKSGSLKRDYLYTKDIANAFVRFLESDVIGDVNICSGKSVTLEEYATCLARCMQKESLLIVENCTAGQPPIIVGDNARLVQEVGYIPEYTITDGFMEILNEQN